MDWHKKKPLSFCNEKLRREKRNAETVKTRESSRFKRLSMIRSMNDSDLISEKSMDSVPEKSMVKKPESRLQQLSKWKEEKEMRKLMQLQNKKKPFYVGSGSNAFPPKNLDLFKNSQNLKTSFINQSIYGGNTSRFQSRVANSPTVAPSKIQSFPKQVSRVPNARKQIPSTVSQVSTTLKNTKLVPSNASTTSLPQSSTTLKSLKWTPNASQSSKLLKNPKPVSSLPSYASQSTTNSAKSLKNFKPVFTASKPVVQKPPVKPLPVPKITVNPPKPTAAVSGIPKTSIPARQPINSYRTIPTKPQQTSGLYSNPKPMAAKIVNKITPKHSAKEIPQIKKTIPAKKEYGLTKPVPSIKPKSGNVKASNNITPNVLKKGEDLKVSNADPTEENSPDLTHLDVSVIKSFAPDGFKFQPPTEISLFFDDDVYAGIHEVLSKFTSRTSTPSKSYRVSSFCSKNGIVSLIEEDTEDMTNKTEHKVPGNNELNINKLNASSTMAEELLTNINDEKPPDFSNVIVDSKPVDSNTADDEENFDAIKDETFTKDDLLIDISGEKTLESTDGAINSNPLDDEAANNDENNGEVKDQTFSKDDLSVNVTDEKAPELLNVLLDFKPLNNEASNIEVGNGEFVNNQSTGVLTECLGKTSQANIALSDKCFENIQFEVSTQSVIEEPPHITLEDKYSGSAKDELIDKDLDESVSNKPLKDEETHKNLIDDCSDSNNSDSTTAQQLNVNNTSFDSFNMEEIANIIQKEVKQMKLDEEELELVDFDEDVLLKCIGKKSTGAIPKRVSVLKTASNLNSIAETDENSPEKSAKKSQKNVSEICTRKSRRLKKSVQPVEVDNYENLLLFEDDVTPTTPRRSLRLQKRLSSNPQISDSPMSPFTPKISSYTNYTPRHSMNLRSRCATFSSDLMSFNSPCVAELDVSQSGKTNITCDFQKLCISNVDENMDPNSPLIALGNTPVKTDCKPRLKAGSRKISLLYSPEKSRMSMRRSIRGDLMSFSPSNTDLKN